MTIGERIKNRRIELGMTQADLAKRCHTTYQAISKYENDLIDTIPTKKLRIVADALDCSALYLMYGEQTPDDMRDMLKDNPKMQMLLSTTSKWDKEDFETLMNMVRTINRRYED